MTGLANEAARIANELDRRMFEAELAATIEARDKLAVLIAQTLVNQPLHLASDGDELLFRFARYDERVMALGAAKLLQEVMSDDGQD